MSDYESIAGTQPPCCMSVVFGNGLSTMTETVGNSFNASINIINSPGIGYYDAGIQWGSQC